MRLGWANAGIVALSCVLVAPVRASPSLRVSIEAPERGTYDPSSFGAPRTSIPLRITNAGAARADVENVRARFTATREGVAFPCSAVARASAEVHEPSTLEPGQSFFFERDLDCSLPLPGAYDVTAYLDVGKPVNSVVGGDPVGSFRFQLEDRPDGPRPFRRKGLYGAFDAERLTRPLEPEAWRRGDYRVVVAIINGSARPLRLRGASLEFSVYRKGSPGVSCTAESAPIPLPASLPSASVHLAHVPLTCAPSTKGEYEVIGRLAVDGERVEVGRLGLVVTDSPLAFFPVPMRGLGRDFVDPVRWRSILPPP